MTIVTETNLMPAAAYYQALHDKDLGGIARCLHPDVHFISPLAEHTGKEAVLDAAQRLLALIKGVNVRAILGSKAQAMVAYDLDFGAPIGTCRTAALMSFQDNLIARIELFFDARPFRMR